MAKGKGKGKGDDDSCGNCCCCICLCILLPPIIFIVGLFILMAKNTRVERINESVLECVVRCRYNKRAVEWNNQSIALFSTAHFSLSNAQVDFKPHTESSGSFYPMRDACKKKGDPAEGCVSTDAYMYKGYMSSQSSSQTSIRITSDGNELVDSSYSTEKVKYYSRSQLGCSKDSYAFLLVLSVGPSAAPSATTREASGATAVMSARSPRISSASASA